MTKKLTGIQKTLVIGAVKSRLSHLQKVVNEWDALPDNAMVNALERFAVAKAKDDIDILKQALEVLQA